MTVHIDAYGNASLREGPAGFSLEGSRLTLFDEPISLSFAKADGCGNALDGALFSVTGVFADDQGHLLNECQATILEGLDVSALSELNFVQGQTYTLEETRAPAGYELISGKLTFSVGTGGEATLDASEVSNGSYAVSADGVAITAVDEPIEAQVTKVSSPDGTALAGATFTLSPADGKNADGQPNHFADASAVGALELVTGEDGVAHIPAATLAAGNAYVLVETAAPAGYVLAEGSFAFTVAPDGTLVAGEGPKAYELLCDGQIGVRVSDDPLPESEAPRRAPGAWCRPWQLRRRPLHRRRHELRHGLSAACRRPRPCGQRPAPPSPPRLARKADKGTVPLSHAGRVVHPDCPSRSRLR